MIFARDETRVVHGYWLELSLIVRRLVVGRVPSGNQRVLGSIPGKTIWVRVLQVSDHCKSGQRHSRNEAKELSRTVENHENYCRKSYS
jgi:hypothetical protein